ncbi:MAG: hypothetical protein M3279_02890 [Actinomycetota bacterium]|nr:hypothetical protein [Actinomycetota bacterium]MDQ3951903.1 hypothetical protein [Actinomycetota bacterium]
MEKLEVSGRDRRQTFFAAIGIALTVFIVGAPVVEAAISRVKLAGGTATSKIKGSDGAEIESEAIGPMGLLQAEGTDGAIAVRNYAGGGGLLGAGDCTASTEPAQGPLKNVVELSGGDIVTGLIVTGTGTVRVTSLALGNHQLPLANFTANAENPNVVVAFGTGLTLTSQLRFTGIDGTACNFVVLGQGQGDNPLAP